MPFPAAYYRIAEDPVGAVSRLDLGRAPNPPGLLLLLGTLFVVVGT